MASANKTKLGNVADLGCSVLLDVNDGDRMTFARLYRNATLKIANVKCSLEPLIGSPFGATFELQNAKLVRINPNGSDVENGIDQEEKIETEIGESIREKDNRNLIDTNTAQNLSSDDIAQMRKDGASGKQIIDALVANSTSFVQKTPFSQEKYMRKKQKKYVPRIILRRPSARSICEAYFAKDPRKIGYCRMDTLALLLSLGNVGANSDILILDSLGGLITAAAAERVGGYGSICSTYYTFKRPPIDMVRLLNIDDPTARSVLRAPVARLIAARKSMVSSLDSLKESNKPVAVDGGKTFDTANDPHDSSRWAGVQLTDAAESFNGDTQSNGSVAAPSDVCGSTSMDVDPDLANVLSSEERVRDSADQLLNLGPISALDEEKGKAARPGMDASDADIERWASQGFTSLLVAAPELDPWTIAQQLLPLLSSSSPFVIYHSYQQPLAECMYQLQANNMALALQLCEPWSREYQVLPSRTHPHMQMSATGGYLLSGFRIC